MQRIVFAVTALTALAPMAVLADPLAAQIARPTPIRIEGSLSVQLQLSPGASVDDQLRQSEEARKAIYELAKRECTTLKDIFKVDCRLMSIRTNSNVQQRNNGTDSVNVNGSASYELLNRSN